MNYFELRIRAFEESDFSRDCAGMPDPSFFDAHLNAFIEDISALKGIEKAEARGQYIDIASKTEMQDVKNILEPIFSEYFCKIRCVSIMKV